MKNVFCEICFEKNIFISLFLIITYAGSLTVLFFDIQSILERINNSLKFGKLKFLYDFLQKTHLKYISKRYKIDLDFYYSSSVRTQIKKIKTGEENKQLEGLEYIDNLLLTLHESKDYENHVKSIQRTMLQILWDEKTSKRVFEKITSMICKNIKLSKQL